MTFENILPSYLRRAVRAAAAAAAAATDAAAGGGFSDQGSRDHGSRSSFSRWRRSISWWRRCGRAASTAAWQRMRTKSTTSVSRLYLLYSYIIHIIL
jgi:hypothetical protein